MDTIEETLTFVCIMAAGTVLAICLNPNFWQSLRNSKYIDDLIKDKKSKKKDKKKRLDKNLVEP